MESRSEAEQEGYDLTSSETESQPVQRCRTKLRSRAVPSPRALRHVNRVKHVGPIGNKRGGRALDVWTFYLPEDGGHDCIFCKYVIILFLRVAELIGVIREIHATNNEHSITHFGPRTATGPIRAHLIVHHREIWMKTCGELGIKVKIPASLRGENENAIINDQGHPHRPFSNENFVDALIEFIVGDDIVSVTSNIAVL